jgi:hypothetical protein
MLLFPAIFVMFGNPVFGKKFRNKIIAPTKIKNQIKYLNMITRFFVTSFLRISFWNMDILTTLMLGVEWSEAEWYESMLANKVS